MFINTIKNSLISSIKYFISFQTSYTLVAIWGAETVRSGITTAIDTLSIPTESKIRLRGQCQTSHLLLMFFLLTFFDLTPVLAFLIFSIVLTVWL